MDGLLHRGHQLFVPSAMRETVVHAAHGRSHAGIYRTFKEISWRYYWPYMWKCIRKWCKLRNKRSHTKAERLVPLEAPGNRPRAIIAYDIAVLPLSRQG